jgi:hypothetical protein
MASNSSGKSRSDHTRWISSVASAALSSKLTAASTQDEIRDNWLAGQNYRVLRFWNHEILGNMAGVPEVIATALPKLPLTRIADATRPLPAGGAR